MSRRVARTALAAVPIAIGVAIGSFPAAWAGSTDISPSLSPLRPVLLPAAITTATASFVYAFTQNSDQLKVAPPLAGIVAATIDLVYTVEIDRTQGYPAILINSSSAGAEDRAPVYTLENHRRDVRITWIVGGINVATSAVLLATAPNVASGVTAAISIATPVVAGLIFQDRFREPRLQTGPVAAIARPGEPAALGWGATVRF